MYAVIRTGGKQYRVAPDDVIEIERLAANAGDQIQFDEVLMVAGDGGVAFGAPLVVGATVAGEVKALTRGPKLIIFKKRRRKHFRRKNGHRQDLMEVRITEILTEGRNPAQRATPAATATEPAAVPPSRPLQRSRRRQSPHRLLPIRPKPTICRRSRVSAPRSSSRSTSLAMRALPRSPR